MSSNVAYPLADAARIMRPRRRGAARVTSLQGLPCSQARRIKSPSFPRHAQRAGGTPEPPMLCLPRRFSRHVGV